MKPSGLIACVLVASCAEPVATPPMPPAVEAPHYLTVCEAPRPLPLPPPVPRTADQLFDWAKRLQSISAVNAANLTVCQGRIARLDAWWHSHLPATP